MSTFALLVSSIQAQPAHRSIYLCTGGGQNALNIIYCVQSCSYVRRIHP